MAEPLAYNPYAFTVHDNPYDTYRRLRDEAPAYWNSDLRFWALSRFEDVQVDHDNKVRFHSGNVSGWRSLPISFTPGLRMDSVAG